MAEHVSAGNEPRRQRLKRHRAERILEAAATVFARKGFHAATIREIAGQADVAEGTIYNYYADKQDLLVAMARQLIARSDGEALYDDGTQDDRTFLAGLLADRFEFASQNSDAIRALMAHVWQDSGFRRQYLGQIVAPLIGALEGRLQQRIAAGGVRPVNTQVVVRAMLGAFLIFLLLSEPGEQPPEIGLNRDELAVELADFFLMGVQPLE
jgi:AcrR family transcriptional regulator